ncbi:MAG TPA: hypothetical protein EYP30_08570 [Archaeoglobaceae archaeon]|nr:hypothetical protein [Archaeoglobaceae archaeon]
MPYKDWENIGIEEKCVRDWAKDLNPYTARNYVYYLKKYLDWVKEQGYFKSAEEMLEDCRKLSYEDRYRHLDILIEFIKSRNTGSRDREINYTAVRNFYNYYRLELPKPSKAERNRMFRPSELDERRAVELKSQMELGELKRLIDNMIPPYKNALLVCFQGAMGANEFNIFNTSAYKQIIDKLDEKEPVRVDLIRKKTSKQKVYKYYTFLGNDAKVAIKEWLEMRLDCECDALFVVFNKLKGSWVPLTGRVLQNQINKTAKKIGLIKPNGLNRYHIFLHEVRDCFKTQCTERGVNKTASEFFLGHQVDKYGYDKAYHNEKWTKSEYMKVEPVLNIVSNPEGNVIDKEELIVESLKRFAKAAYGVDITDLTIAKMRSEYPDLTESELIARIIRSEIKKQTKEFKAVSEEEIVTYLNKGWEIVQTLNGGKVIVSRERI